MFAGIDLVRAGALAAHLLQLEGEEPLAAGREGALDVLRHHPRKELGGPTGFLAEGLEDVVPALVVEDIQPELHLVGVFAAALHPGVNAAAFKADREDIAFTGVGPGPLQALLEAVAVDQLHPLLNPPGLLAQALIAELGGDAVGGGGEGQTGPATNGDILDQH